MAFVQAYKLSEVESLASEVLAGYPPSEPPALNIASPANGTTVSSPSVTVSGTVTDKRVITSFTVDGKAVSVAANGRVVDERRPEQGRQHDRRARDRPGRLLDRKGR